MMRSVVCGDRIDRSVLDSFDDCLKVISRSERRMHLEVRVICLAAVICQSEVMRACLTCDLYSPCLRVTYHAHAALCGYVADVHRDIEIFREDYVSCDHDILSCRRDSPDADSRGYDAFVHCAFRKALVFAVIENRKIEV